MKSIVIFLLIMGFASISSGQKIIKVEKVSEYSTYVTGNNFEGVIFNTDYKFNPKYKRFTPTLKQIEFFENSIIGDLNEIYKVEANAYKKRSIPEILKRLTKYRRQYFGYINEKGNKVIEAHFFLVKDRTIGWKTGEVIVRDGGFGFWQLTFVGTDTLFEFSVNGTA
jgi:hypothetical protein